VSVLPLDERADGFDDGEEVYVINMRARRYVMNKLSKSHRV